MKRKKIVSLLLTAALALCLLSGCTTHVGEHTHTYFSQMQNVAETAANARKAESAAGQETAEAVNENALPAPANLTVDEEGNYSFDAVENAQYYYVYIYDSDSSVNAAAQSGKIPEDGSASYSGNINDFARLTYEDWSVRVTAYPDFDNSDLAASPEAKATYIKSGAVDPGEPEFYYMWTVVSGTLEIKIDGMNYSSTAYPTDVALTLTNRDDPSDVITIDLGAVTASSASGKTAEAKPDAVYDITADFAWDESFVTNPSFTATGGEARTSGSDNLIDGDFYYTSAIFLRFDFPHVQMDFDPVTGGEAGVWKNQGGSNMGWGSGEASGETDEDETDYNCYFDATPKAAENGALYSYNIHVTSPSGAITASPKLSPGSGSTEHIFGTLDIFPGGTFQMEIEYQYMKTDMMNAAVYYVPGVICEGTWTQNANGTINLSYDHENAYETDYDIVTELTGQAKIYFEANPEANTNNASASGEASGEASDATASNEPESVADGSGEATPDNS